MKDRVTIYTIAEKLNISATTVYRALNNKPRISEETKKKILQLAEELGFKPNALAKTLNRKSIRIAFYDASGFSDFNRHIIRGVEEMEKELHDYRVNVDYYNFIHKNRFRSANNIEDHRKILDQISSLDYNGIIMHGFEDEIAYKQLEEKNIPIALVVNDLKCVKRKFCVQYDSYTAGCMAAELLFWNVGKGGKVALASGFDDIQVHKQIVKGFLEYAKFLSLDVVTVLYNKDDNDIAFEHTNKLFKEHPDLKGIYVNSFTSSGVIRSVIKNGMTKQVHLITTDINNEIRECLENGIVSASIFQDQYRQGRYGLRYLYDYITSHQKIDDVTYIYPQIILRSNMALYND